MLRLSPLRYAKTSFVRHFNAQYFNRTRNALTWKSYALLAFPATCFALGYWQIGRRKWKLNLIAQVENNMRAAPIPLPSSTLQSSDLPEYCPVTIKGHFDHTREVLIGPRSLITDLIPPLDRNRELLGMQSAGQKSRSFYDYTSPPPPGYLVITPFFLEDRPGISILVNRGWVHFSYRDPAFRKDGQVSGTVELTGFVRYPEKPPLVAPIQHPLPCIGGGKQHPHYQYCCRQVDAMAKRLGTLPVFIDANYDSSLPGGPVGGQTRVVIRNEHASYILTWFSLAIISTGWWLYAFLL